VCAFLLHPPTKRAARWLSLALSHTHLFINDSLAYTLACCLLVEREAIFFICSQGFFLFVTFKGNTSAAEIKRAKYASEKVRESIDLSDQDLAI